MKRGRSIAGSNGGNCNFMLLLFIITTMSLMMLIACDVVDINAMELFVSEEISLNGILLLKSG